MDIWKRSGITKKWVPIPLKELFLRFNMHMPNNNFKKGDKWSHQVFHIILSIKQKTLLNYMKMLDLGDYLLGKVNDVFIEKKVECCT